jgi:hypothetical protein
MGSAQYRCLVVRERTCADTLLERVIHRSGDFAGAGWSMNGST